MDERSGDWVLAIDFGTSNTAAAFLAGDKVQAIQLESGSTTMPSAVVLTASGFRVGRPAENARRARPGSFEGAPKRLLGQEQVSFEDREVAPEQLVAEVIKVVRLRAFSRAGGSDPRSLVLTLPAQWGPAKRSALVRAAELAGFPPDRIVLLSEPIAALHAYAEPARMQPGDRVAVVDFGAGTCDVAVLERTADATPGRDLAVVASDGDERLGGNDLDDRLHTWVLDQLRSNGDDDLVDLLADPQHLGDALTLRTVVRAAKQDLSEHPDTEIAVSVAGHERVLRVSRDEYEALIAPDMARVADLTRRVLETSGTHRLTALYLTGGSSLTPAVAHAMHEVTGILAAPLGDPKLAVAEGALRSPVVTGTMPAPAPAPAPAPSPEPTPRPEPTVGRAALPRDGGAGRRADASEPAALPRTRATDGPVPPQPDAAGAGAERHDAAHGGAGGPVVVHERATERTGEEVRSDGPPRRPWYTRPLAVAAMVVVAVVVGVVGLMATVLNDDNRGGSGGTADGGSGGSTDGGTSDGGSTDGGTTDSGTDGTTDGGTTDDGTEGDGGTEEEPPTVVCWDGSVRHEPCPPLEGPEAAFWLVDTDVVETASCQEGDATQAVGQPEEYFWCTWPDMTGYVMVARYTSAGAGADVWRQAGYEESEWFVSGWTEPNGPRFVTTFTVDGVTYHDEVRCFTAVPYCFGFTSTDPAGPDAAQPRLAVPDPDTLVRLTQNIP